MWIKAKVIKGLEIGAKFGIATANLEFNDAPSLAEGVYLVNVRYEKELYGGLLHFGARKTFGGEFSAEVHLLNFDKDIYDDRLEIQIEKKLRAVQAFKNADALFTQIERDIVSARKYFLRQQIAAHWQTLSLSDEAHLASQALTHLGANAEFLEASRVFLYAPVLHKEITFVAALMKAYAGKQYFFPKIEQNEINFYAVKHYQDLQLGKFRLLEPPKTEAVQPCNKDVMLVPAVAADKTGNRLGQGGGYYDKFLSHLKTDPVRMTVLPWFALVDEVPTEPHDQSLDRVITCRL